MPAQLTCAVAEISFLPTGLHVYQHLTEFKDAPFLYRK
jgi:hypothetical protein